MIDSIKQKLEKLNPLNDSNKTKAAVFIGILYFDDYIESPEILFTVRSSKVSTHSELAWILNCVCRMGWLNRMTQFKEKAGKNRENVSVGLFTYEPS